MGVADVVAHPGQEVGFCRIGQLGFLQCLAQGLVGFFQGRPGPLLLPGLPGNVPPMMVARIWPFSQFSIISTVTRIYRSSRPS